MSADQLLELARSLVWPVVAIFALLLLREPLAAALTELGRRTTKLDLHVVALEFRPDFAPD